MIAYPAPIWQLTRREEAKTVGYFVEKYYSVEYYLSDVSYLSLYLYLDDNVFPRTESDETFYEDNSVLEKMETVTVISKYFVPRDWMDL